MTERRYCPLERISRQYSVYFSEPSAPNMPPCITSAKPRMALSGVRSSWLMLARNSDFDAVRALGLRLLLEVALGEVGELLRLQLQRLARFLQVRHRGDELPFGIDELLLMALQGRDVRADRDVAAVLGAAFVDLQPAPVAELGLEGARARPCRCCR